MNPISSLFFALIKNRRRAYKNCYAKNNSDQCADHSQILLQPKTSVNARIPPNSGNGIVVLLSLMEHVTHQTAVDRLYLRGLEIRYERRVGLWVPIMWHLALRGHTAAMIILADWFSDDNTAKSFGTPAKAFSAAGLYYRAYRKGNALAANNAAMSLFNLNDMTGYRRWLRRAGQTWDADAQRQLRYFETRLSHTNAAKVRRLRPMQKRDEFA